MLILLAYRPGLRVSELVALRWDQVDLKLGHLHVARLKNGVASTHALRGSELRALRRVQAGLSGVALRVHDRAPGPLTDSAMRKIVARAGEVAKLELGASAHAAARLRLQAGERGA